MTQQHHPMPAHRAAMFAALTLGLGLGIPLTASGSGGVAAPPDTAIRMVPAPRNDFDRLLDEADSLIKAHGGMASPNARLYLTWNEPYGLPRASRTHYPRSRDPLSADTLYLSCLPGRPGRGFLGFRAFMDFHATGNDTLGAWWHMERGAINNRELSIEFGPDTWFPARQPWALMGTGTARMTRTPTTAHLDILFAVPYDKAAPVAADSVYTLCRVILHHRKALPGCAQPVCIEWSSGELYYWLRDTPTIHAGERFVSYAGNGTLCAPFYSTTVPSPHATPAASRSRLHPPSAKHRPH